MGPTPYPRVKVCCITSIDEARLAVRCGAAALGLVSEMPSGPGVIAEETITEIAAAIPPAVTCFLLTCRTSAEAIGGQVRRTGVTTVQLCDRLPEDELRALRALGMPVKIVQVVHVTGPSALEEAESLGHTVDAVLLDSGNPEAAVKELGGTGRRHDWDVSARIREALAVPVFLAGGLRPENAAEAVRRVRPYGLDVCSGVRTDGRLDEIKLERFFAAVRDAP